MRSFTDWKNLNREDLLALLGLQTRTAAGGQWMTLFGTFAVGVAVGAGFALLLAPKSGRELRSELKSRFPDFLADVRKAEQPATNHRA